MTSELPLIAASGTILAILLITVVRDLVVKARQDARYEEEQRIAEFRKGAMLLWLMTAIAVGGWLVAGKDFAELGFFAPAGITAWIGWAITAAGVAYLSYSLYSVATSGETRQQVRSSLEQNQLDLLQPSTPGGFRAFQTLSVTAGITEEVIFRGFAIGVLAIWLPLWAAAAIPLVIFCLAHAYQGWQRIVQIVPISVVLTIIFLMTGSLLPGIVLHIAADVLGGWIIWRATAGDNRPARRDVGLVTGE